MADFIIHLGLGVAFAALGLVSILKPSLLPTYRGIFSLIRTHPRAGRVLFFFFGLLWLGFGIKLLLTVKQEPRATKIPRQTTVASTPIIEEPPAEPLWPGDAPGATGKTPADIPTLSFHPAPPAQATGAAALIFPGGGYSRLMTTYEGHDIARWLNAQGIAGIVVCYRVAPYRHPCPLHDAARALRMVRSRAAEWKLDSQRIGVIGFSAGGHVASTLGTHFDAGDPKAADPIEQQSSRPDFLALIYPVVTMGPQRHGGSHDHLLGNKAAPELEELLSNEKQVTAQTPPAFLAHAKDDEVVPVENSRMFYAALQKNNVSAEYLELEKGGHGFGGTQSEGWAAWQQKCSAWFKTRGLLDKK